ncbi:uncharacterized protein CEXT_377121 [Caerostris extrusa]|uniref:Uncharacterized protein n=1 Tax=Caerostris extrusa TaxID=172846 RepID=A0AAV4W0I1_CAEEX|nr:uncharacterized protein CEXT_377121 [Caerostris extrusa]
MSQAKWASLVSQVVSQSCEQSHFDRCLKQLAEFTDRGDLLFASSENSLAQECVEYLSLRCDSVSKLIKFTLKRNLNMRAKNSTAMLNPKIAKSCKIAGNAMLILQAQSALNCVTRYAKKCLSVEDRAHLLHQINGPQKMTLGLCVEDTDLKTKYIQSIPCLRNMSEGLLYCKEKYERNQKDIILVEYEDKTHLECCSFDGYRRCLRMLMETQDGCREGTPDVVYELVSRMGGVFSEEVCSEHFQRCTGAASTAVQTAASLFLALLTPAVSVLLLKFL